jgi:carbamate kinase
MQRHHLSADEHGLWMFVTEEELCHVCESNERQVLSHGSGPQYQLV